MDHPTRCFSTTAALRFGWETTRANLRPLLWIGAVATLLQVVALVSRTEAWHVCVSAAGGRLGRRRLYRAASVGYLGNQFNSNFGLAVRIAALRRSAPRDSPRPSVLVAAEVPLQTVGRRQ